MDLLFTSEKQEVGVVKRADMIKSGKNAYLAIWFVKTKETKDEKKKDFHWPETYSLSQIILSTE